MTTPTRTKGEPARDDCDECEGTGKRYSHVYGGYINRECWFCKGTGKYPVAELSKENEK